MNTKVRFLILTACMLIAIPAAAQENAAKKGPEKKAEAPAKAARATSNPKAEMEKIKWLIGDWTWTDKYEDSPIAKAGVGSGTMTVKLGPGDHYLIADFKKVTQRGEETGHEIYFWDTKESAYKRLAIGSRTSGIDTGTGKWEDDKLVYVWEYGEGSQKLVVRAIYSDIQPNSVTIKIDASLAGAPPKLLVTSTCVKK